MISLSASVGKAGENKRADVALIQKLLNHQISHLSNAKKIVVDGLIGRQTIALITQFQRQVMRLWRPDGRVDPNGKSIQALAEGFDIAFPVGEGGINLKMDVKFIQTLLNYKIDEISGASTLTEDGLIGKKTISAIHTFQETVMKLSRPDGRVDPSGRTLKFLIEENDAEPVDLSQWNGDSARWSEEKKLASLNPLFRLKVKATLTGLRRQGFKPKIVYGWRSQAVQMELYRKRRTKVKFSFHNATLKNGTPNAFAADIIDKRYAWSNSPQTTKFWQALGKTAKQHKLYWGGDWRSFKDWAHVQYHRNNKLYDIKKASKTIA